jgi:hypothetical protein
MMTSVPDIEKHEDSTRVADHASIMDAYPSMMRVHGLGLLNRHRKDWR